uniref:Uncharacterized protein n=1 Tax=Oryza sativa subsp. japonica TaxID=39947 RepID=Q84YI6_ORYSJ|nr:hypothetical protein [Oryza sativa Japonica Group]BAD10055.1 hypothetical protein [Oryza sativa Japonica Group]
MRVGRTDPHVDPLLLTGQRIPAPTPPNTGPVNAAWRTSFVGRRTISHAALNAMGAVGVPPINALGSAPVSAHLIPHVAATWRSSESLGATQPLGSEGYDRIPRAPWGDTGAPWLFVIRASVGGSGRAATWLGGKDSFPSA